MFKLEVNAPPQVASLALGFAHAGLAAQNSRKKSQERQLFEGEQEASLSLLGIPVFTVNTAASESLSPDAFIQSSWVFFLLIGEEARAIVSVRNRMGHSYPSAIEFFEKGSPTYKALQAASELTNQEGEYSIRLIEITDIHASFIWVFGSKPTFVDRLSIMQYDTDTFKEELQRKWSAKRRRPPEPGPDKEPSGSALRTGPGGMGD